MNNYQRKRYMQNANKLIENFEAYMRKNEKNENTSLQYMTEMEMKVLTMLRKSLPLLTNLEGETRERITQIFEELQQEKYRIAESYIAAFNEEHGFQLDSHEYLEKYSQALLKETTEQLVLRKVAQILIPGHPKDEYTETRKYQRQFIIHSGETNTGKTYNALQALKSADNGVYLAPLRLLALEVYQLLNDDGISCTLTTGEEDIIVKNARHVSSTIEKLDIDVEYEAAVIDEAQMIADRQRGGAWTKAILGVKAKKVHVCCSPNAVELITKLIVECGETYEVYKYVRDTKLVVEHKKFEFPHSVAKGDALIVFSKRSVLNISDILTTRGWKVSAIYGNLPPETRRKQMRQFIDGETDVVVSTDAIGMGLNLPIRRIVFMQTYKYDGLESRHLYDTEIKQISGRAGRKNLYDIGYVNAESDKNYIREALKAELKVISAAYYLPLAKYVLNFPAGKLSLRLKICTGSVKAVDYIRKAAIDEQLELLGEIENRYQLSIEEQYKLIFIPFNKTSYGLTEQWLEYVRLYAECSDIPVPVKSSDDLKVLEYYYESLGLYYAFCKTMEIKFNAEKILQMKYDVAERIDKILRTEMKKLGSKCQVCGVKLDWSSPHSKCDRCYYLSDCESWTKQY